MTASKWMTAESDTTVILSAQFLDKLKGSRGLNDSVSLEDELSYNVTEVDASAVVTSEHTRDGSRVVGLKTIHVRNRIQPKEYIDDSELRIRFFIYLSLGKIFLYMAFESSMG
nr:unnamed protein product [Spirometra erinaceieuropaei]